MSRGRMYTAVMMWLAVVFLMQGADARADSRKETTVGAQVVVADVERVFRESSAADKARDHLAQVRQRLEDGVKKISAVYGPDGTHPSAETLQAGQQRLAQQYRAEEQAANTAVMQVLTGAVQTWTQAHPGTVVVARGLLLGADSGSDITGELLTQMAKATPVFGQLPEVEVKVPEKDAPDEKKAQGDTVIRK
ncbi:hypothetical protein RKI04_11180 [Citrobacter amalonaticus]|uniref:hypothetical protein n=1 Tax=Citrobacter amalonaticus TaxID=35703 RepID=UPI00287A5293|nr:hypothetical protein [Citrobacter amalonaticus]MDS4036817.1 hypothetical protein [Citrobacter amalonaticus]